VAENEALSPAAIEPSALLEALLAAAPVGMGFLDPGLRFVRLNAALAAMHGLDRQAAVGRTYGDLWPAMPSGLAEGLAGVIELGEPVIDHEARLHENGPGAARDVLASFYPVRDQSHGIVGVGTVVVDITQRTVSEQALRRSEAIKSAILTASLDCLITMDADGRFVELNPAAERTFGYRASDVIGREVAATIVPSSLRDQHRAGLARHLAGESRRAIGKLVELTGLRADGTEFPVEVALARIDVDERPLFAGSFRDITERKRAEAELRRHAAEQAALRRVATLVAAETDEQSLFASVCEEVGHIVEAEVANLLRYENDGATVVGGWSQPGLAHFAVGERLPADGDTLVARVRHSGRPGRVDSYDEIGGELAGRVRHMGLRSAVAAPINLGRELWGFVAAATIREEPFPPGAEVQIGRFAELMSQALANAQAHRALRASRARLVDSADAERRRLERNLHDGAQQRLVAVRLALRVAENTLARDAERGLEMLRQARQELDAGLEELRELARGLHPAILTDKGLGPALEALSDRSPVAVDLMVDLDDPLPAPMEAAFYYVSSEALTNAARHSQARRVTIAVSQHGEHAILHIRDDGTGGAELREGGGLRGLTDRVEALGGQLIVESAIGCGTTLEARVPLRGSDAMRGNRAELPEPLAQ
jgi:PAS domain S-box-containing protein